MARFLLLICLVFAILALVGVAAAQLAHAASVGSRAAHESSAPSKGNDVERISYAALILLMLGVTSGLLGGL
jgi:Flp pilus assembly protein TadG